MGPLIGKKSDGSDVLVIGTAKMKQIEDEPLLRCYFELFQRELSKRKRTILVIGYGFGDEHINKIISDSLEKNEAKLIIICPLSFEEFKDNLLENRKSNADTLVARLTNYYPYELAYILKRENIFKEIIGKVRK